MLDRSTLQRVLLGREVAAAFGLITVLYLVRVVRFQPLQIPAYLLIVAYDIVEVVVPAITPYHPIGFPVFLYVVAVLGAALARSLRSRDRGVGGVRAGLGGVGVLVGMFSLAFGAFIGGPLVAPADNPTPLLITGTAGVLLVLAGWLLLGRPTGPFDRTHSAGE